MAFTVKQLDVAGRRRDCYSGEETEIACRLELKEVNHLGWIVHIIHNGVTGFEYFSATEKNLEEKFKAGWLACAGRRGEWDTLYIPSEEMLKALDSLGLI